MPKTVKPLSRDEGFSRHYRSEALLSPWSRDQRHRGQEIHRYAIAVGEHSSVHPNSREPSVNIGNAAVGAVEKER
jgi:hypothetical protein